MRKLIALILALAAPPSCGQKNIEQINFYVTFPPGDGGKVDELATQAGAIAGMQVFRAPRSVQDGDTMIEVYDHDASIDIASVPCDPKGNRTQGRFSRDAFFVSIARTSQTHRVSLRQLANLLQRKAADLGGRISTVTPGCYNSG